MILFRHELRQGRTALIVWTASVGFLLAVCVGLYPEMQDEMAAAGRLFASMGAFTAAFGMDRLDFGSFMGFYAVECGNVLALGGAFYAALTGVSALAKEERGRTAEFLLTHPLSRARAVTEKLAAVLVQVVVMDLALLVLALLGIRLIGQAIPWGKLLALHGACWLMHTELACLCFGLSAFLRRGGPGLGMGLAAGAYLLDLAANMTERAGFLKYLTPFGYCDGADILTNGWPDPVLAALGALLAWAGAAAAYIRYCKKDIR